MQKGFAVGEGFHFRLIRVQVGSEEKLVKDLQRKKRKKGPKGSPSPSSRYFKILGNYDILEITPLSGHGLYHATQVLNDSRILGFNSLVGFCPPEREETFLKCLDDSVAPSLIILKAHDRIFEDYGLEGLRQIINHLGDSPHRIYPLLGLGYYEIILWVEADNLEEIFPLLRKIRSLSVSDVFQEPAPTYGREALFQTSTTIPLISYSQVIGPPENFEKLRGYVWPLLKIKCASGHEARVAGLLGDKAETHLLLGMDDLISICKTKEKLEDFIPFLLHFREQNQVKAVFDTVSQIPQIEPLNSKSKARPPKVPKQQASPVAPLFKKLDKLSHQTNIELNQFLLSEISNLCGLISNQTGIQAMRENSFDFIYTLNLSLPSMLDQYLEAVTQGHREDASTLEWNLLRFAKQIRASLSQHYSCRGITDYREDSNAPTFASSLAPIIKAFSVVPHQLFQIISKSSVPTKLIEKSQNDIELQDTLKEFRYPWNGFLVLDLPESYQIDGQAEIILVPYNDIFRFLNVITLSHECSHGYYVRIDFETLEADVLGRIPPKFSRDEPSSETIETHLATKREFVFELFAHWFDYRHFFKGERDFYLWSIWRTYLNIPRVYKNKKEYWARSLFIWLCYSWSSFRPQIDSFFYQARGLSEYPEKVISLCNEAFQQMTDFCKKKFGRNLKPFELDQEQQEEVCQSLFRYLFWVDIFEEFYLNKGVIDAVNRSYPGLLDHVDAILAGEVVTTPIENPFLLLREILHRFYEKNDLIDPPDKVTIAFLFSFLEASRKFRRSLNEYSTP